MPVTHRNFQDFPRLLVYLGTQILEMAKDLSAINRLGHYQGVMALKVTGCFADVVGQKRRRKFVTPQERDLPSRNG